MKYISNISIAVLCALIISCCQCKPHRSVIREELSDSIETNVISAVIRQWLQSVFVSKRNKDVTSGIMNNNLHADTKQEAIEKRSALSMQFDKKKDGLEETVQSQSSRVHQRNPFIRTKRSMPGIPNLPLMVQNLTTFLNSSQYLGVNVTENPLNYSMIPTGQPTTCPSTSDTFLQSNEPNLKSASCPWILKHLDLGENAFPRNIAEASCLCNNSCIGDVNKRCAEIKREFIYLNRTGWKNGLAILETKIRTISVGCHCITGSGDLPPTHPIFAK